MDLSGQRERFMKSIRKKKNNELFFKKRRVYIMEEYEEQSTKKKSKQPSLEDCHEMNDLAELLNQLTNLD